MRRSDSPCFVLSVSVVCLFSELEVCVPGEKMLTYEMIFKKIGFAFFFKYHVFVFCFELLNKFVRCLNNDMLY